jgi:hypothetical protein
LILFVHGVEITHVGWQESFMDTLTDSPPPAAPLAERRSAFADSWTIPGLVIAATLVSIGLSWDISWHLTIGRDTFWTPAHIAIYLGGASGGSISGWLAIRTTYLASPFERAGSVGLWGGHAPFGAWVAIWGAVAMITSAPFDNWWHNAYGLDVKIISPPHVLLFLGVVGLRLGTGLLVLREQNRPGGSGSAAWLFCWVGGLVMSGTIGLFLTEIWPNRQHSADYFLLMSMVIPFFLAAIGRASTLRWGATVAAAGMMLFYCLIIWILQLFPATPKLGPIYNPVTHMVPPPFPQWTVLPAIVIDLLRQRVKLGRGWRRDLVLAVAAGALFVAVFLPIQWEFSKFLLTPAANNWFFAGGRNWGYNSVPNAGWTEFYPDEAGWHLRSVLFALIAAVSSSFFGLRVGQWMTRVKR